MLVALFACTVEPLYSGRMTYGSRFSPLAALVAAFGLCGTLTLVGRTIPTFAAVIRGRWSVTALCCVILRCVGLAAHAKLVEQPTVTSVVFCCVVLLCSVLFCCVSTLHASVSACVRAAAVELWSVICLNLIIGFTLS